MFEKPRIRKNFDIVQDNISIIFKSEHNKIKFEGKDIQNFIQKVIPLLNGDNTVYDIIRKLNDFNKEDIEKCLDLLEKNNIIEDMDSKNDIILDESKKPQTQLFKELGIPLNISLKRLINTKIAIVGLGGYGSYITLSLANEGITKLKCLDNSIVRNEDIYLSTLYKEIDIGKKKEEVIKKYFEKFKEIEIETFCNDEINSEELKKWISGRDLVICCIDKGYSSIFFWLNKICLDLNIPLLYASIEGMEGTIGPLIIPNVTACYMCYNMRVLANETCYSDSMLYQKYLDKNKKDELFRRSNLSINSSLMGNLVALEVIKFILLFSNQKLIGSLYQFNFLSMESKFLKIL